MPDVIATSAAALGAMDIQYVELADQISKDDRAVAGALLVS
jgi:hypothetical protein